MSATDSNKIKYGLSNVHYAKIVGFDEDTGLPTYATPKRLPGAVSLSLDAEGGTDNFYADNGVYYVMNTNAGYSGELEVAMITFEFEMTILGESIDSNGVICESSTDEVSPFALMFEFDGDKEKIRHVFYNCTVSRPKIEGSTTEDSKSPKTDSLSFKATPLVNGRIKMKTSPATSTAVYNAWYDSVYQPSSTPSTPPQNANEE